jgi:prevent-host-death family protein
VLAKIDIVAKAHSIHAAKTHLSRLVERAERGEDVIIARGSTPVARLTRLRRDRPGRRFGAMRGRARVTRAFFEPLPEAELAGWE